MVARLQVEGLNINAEMIRRGAAWVYRKYTNDASVLALEAQAREAKRGLWSLPDAERIPPWEWRQSSAPSSVSKVMIPAAVPASQTCGPNAPAARGHPAPKPASISRPAVF